MKVLHVVRSLDPLGGGVAEGLVSLASHLLSNGCESTLLCLDPPDATWIVDGKHIHGIGPVNGKYGFKSGIRSLIAGFSRSHDLVIIHGIWQYHSFATWLALHGSGIPYFVYTHGMLDPWFRTTYPLKHLKKWAYWPWADYRVLRDAAAVLFTTEQERRLASESFWLYKANEVVVGFGTSVPPDDAVCQRQAFLHRFPHLQGQRILLFLSRIHPKKGVDLLIEAFAALASIDPRLQLVIAGPDQMSWQAALQQRSAELGVAERITWPGMLSGELKWGAFRCAELFCLPSHQENFGIVVVEAMACGLPVAIAEPVNISAEVSAAGAGLVHADTLVGTMEALRDWIALPDEEKALMGQRGEQLFRKRFDFASVARNLLPLLETAIKQQPVRLDP